jgi:hypothetical protein
VSAFTAGYVTCFEAYLREPQEETLQAAYELGRRAVEDGMSVLDLAIAHHAALRAAVREQPGEPTLGAAEEFFLESLAAFEMIQRGFREARDSAALQRRHAEMLRQLSDFLADASLTLQASGSLDEMLQLVCEQARELLSAPCCMVTIGEEPQVRCRSASYPEDVLGWRSFATWLDLSGLDRAVRDAAGTLRLSAEEAGDLIGQQGARLGSVPGEWLGVALRSLDGGALGAMHVVSEAAGRFTVLDEAVISHLGQMAAATVERALVHRWRMDRADPPP